MALDNSSQNQEEADSAPDLQIDVDRYKVDPGSHVHLAQLDPRTKGDFAGDKAAGEALLVTLTKRLAKLQEVFYAEGKHRLLVVLQAMDTGGKDGTISHVFDKVNPQGVDVASFKRPSEVELAHDYLWRIHHHVPGNGQIVIFNRSHYEDVLIARVHQLVPKDRWKRRYEHINAFEKMLADEGTTIIKFFLHISKEEQRMRLQSRIDKADKHWKFDPNDLTERKKWDDYMEAYEEAIRRTSTEVAPWYIVPADRKWYRNLVVTQTVVQTIEELHPTYPKSDLALKDLVIE